VHHLLYVPHTHSIDSYGPTGQEVVFAALKKLFPSCPQGCQPHQPAVHAVFLHEVVAPEVILLMMQDDLGLEADEAMSLMDTSRAYGLAAHDLTNAMDDWIDDNILVACRDGPTTPHPSRPRPGPIARVHVKQEPRPVEFDFASLKGEVIEISDSDSD
jgi:hypothetical protein